MIQVRSKREENEMGVDSRRKLSPPAGGLLKSAILYLILLTGAGARGAIGAQSMGTMSAINQQQNVYQNRYRDAQIMQMIDQRQKGTQGSISGQSTQSLANNLEMKGNMGGRKCIEKCKNINAYLTIFI